MKRDALQTLRVTGIAAPATAARSLARSAVPALGFLLLGLLVLPPFTDRGHLLLVDWSPTPSSLWAPPEGLGVQPLPLEFLLQTVKPLMPTWLLQRLILLGALACAGIAAYRTAPVRTSLGRAFAGTLYAFNPFVYSRILAGHWTLLVAYALAPFAVRAILSFRSNPSRRRGLVAGVWVAGLALISIHALLLLIPLGLASFQAAWSLRGDRRATQAVGWCWLAVALGTLWWIIPVAAMGRAPRSGIETIDVFATTSVGGAPVPVTVAGLRGFWIDRLNPADPSGWPLVAVVVVGLSLLGAVAGVRDERRSTVLTVLASAIVASILAIGVAHGATEPIARAFYRWVPGALAFREPQKLLVLLALAYAWLGGIGVEELARRRARGWRSLAAALVALPLALTPQLLGAAAGRLRPVSYPASWAMAERILASTPGARALFLPWRLYVPLPFNDPGESVANPGPSYFSVPVIASENPELGSGLAAPDHPLTRRIEALLADPSADLANELAALDIEFVLLLPSAEPSVTASLVRSPGFEVVVSSRDLILLRRSSRYDGAVAGATSPV